MTTVYSQTLYQSGAKGEIRIWMSWVVENDDETATIFKSHGVEGGKMTETHRIISCGKNIGKKNETTPLQQAVAEAKSDVAKKIREGYSSIKSQRGKTEVVLPMLAQDMAKIKKMPSFPLYLQPKLDGVRMIVECQEDGTLSMTTRSGKDVLFMDHIRHVLTSVLRPGEVLDGELFTFEKTFEEITGIVRKSVKEHTCDEDILTIQYHIFDAFEREQEAVPFCKRMLLVDEILHRIPSSHKYYTSVISVDTTIVNDEDEANIIHEKNVSNGYEGTMYRTIEGPYKLRLRSKDLIKRKDFQTEEYQIIDALEADGRDIGTVIWMVQNSAGNQFKVRPRGSLDMRRNWWHHREEYIGKLLTVRFQNLTEAGIPRFPVGLSIRDYE